MTKHIEDKAVMSDLEKTYQPKSIESRWNQYWQEKNYYQAQGNGPSYCIMLPPPNVTGTLHMGHGFQQTLMDALIRYHRMQGDATHWQGGTDHAGIATQMVVERQLKQKGEDRHSLGREKFTDAIWQWKSYSGDTINQQMRRLGVSIDWSSTKFTLDEGMTQATLEAFVRLYREGLIYRGKRLVNWDPVLQTAISDLEVESKETNGHLWHIRYPFENGNGHFVVATTRPETLFGDTAIAVHPEDPRYQSLVGQRVKVPLCDRTIPVIADPYVDAEFGSGCLKITPAHDFNDYQVGLTHQLDMINILNKDGTLNHLVPENFQGKTTKAARQCVVDALTAQGLIEHIESHTHMQPTGDRSGAVIEPFLTDQWFLKMATLAEPAINAVNTGALTFIPNNWSKTYLQWLENTQDWCLSRQLWWGHRIPAWYDSDGNIFVGKSESDVRQHYQLSPDFALTQDPDVLDTWFSSSLWPFATLGWPQKTAMMQRHYPTNVLVTGFDIIFFWVARMVMMGHKFTGKLPFSQVYITGLIRDAEGRKMSKSKGNVIDPIDLIDGISLTKLIEKRTKGLMQPQHIDAIEKATRAEFKDGIAAYGTDALRFTFCALASTGRDIHFDHGRIAGYRNFCNKLWNAARFVLMHTEEQNTPQSNAIKNSSADEWIQYELNVVTEKVHQHFSEYRFDRLASVLYEFVWDTYCDWYLELAKCQLHNINATKAEKRGTQHTLLAVLEQVLRLMHPIMPFITEEIWQRIAPRIDIQGDSILKAPYPIARKMEQQSHEEIQWLKSLVSTIRTIRSEMNVSPGKTIPIIFIKGKSREVEKTNAVLHYLQALAKVKTPTWQNEPVTIATASALIGDTQLHIPLADIIDTQAEQERLTKEINKKELELEKINNKLNNPSYVNKAPNTVVEQERHRHEQTVKILTQLKEQRNKIMALEINP